MLVMVEVINRLRNRRRTSKRVYITIRDPNARKQKSRSLTIYGMNAVEAERAIERIGDDDSGHVNSEESTGSQMGPNDTPLAGGTESADSPLAGDEKVSPSDSPSTPDAPRSGERRVSMQPADGTAAPQTAHGSAGLKLVGQSLAVSGDGDHAVKGNVSEAERHRRD